MGAYYAAAPGDSIDGSRYPWGWEQREFDDSAGHDPQRRGAGGEPAVVGRRSELRADAGAAAATARCAGWQLEPRDPFPPMEETPSSASPRVRRATGVARPTARSCAAPAISSSPRNVARRVLLDQSHTTNAYPVLETSGGAGSTVTLTYAEALIDSAGRKGNRNDVDGRTIRGVRDVFQPDGGAHRRFQTLYWRSFRYVQIDIETAAEPLRVHDLHGIFTAYPFVERGRFASDLAVARRRVAHELERRAHRRVRDVHGHAVLRAAPVRRRHARCKALISLYVAGDDRLMRQAIEHFDESRIPEGITASRYPSALTQLIPPFSLIYVAMVHDYIMHRTTRVRARAAGRHARHPRLVRPSRGRDRHARTDAVLELRRLGDRVGRGRAARARQRPLGDDQPALRVRAPARRGARGDLGTRGAGADYRARADSCSRAVRARAWDSARGFFRDAPDTSAYSQQTNVLAMLTDAVPAAEQRALMERVLADTTLTPASYYFGFYVLRGAAKGGARRPLHRAARAVARDAGARPDVGARESGADALRHARVGGAPELRTACDGARRAPVESPGFAPCRSRRPSARCIAPRVAFRIRLATSKSSWCARVRAGCGPTITLPRGLSGVLRVAGTAPAVARWTTDHSIQLTAKTRINRCFYSVLLPIAS